MIVNSNLNVRFEEWKLKIKKQFSNLIIKTNPKHRIIYN